MNCTIHLTLLVWLLLSSLCQCSSSEERDATLPRKRPLPSASSIPPGASDPAKQRLRRSNDDRVSQTWNEVWRDGISLSHMQFWAHQPQGMTSEQNHLHGQLGNIGNHGGQIRAESSHVPVDGVDETPNDRLDGQTAASSSTSKSKKRTRRSEKTMKEVYRAKKKEKDSSDDDLPCLKEGREGLQSLKWSLSEQAEEEYRRAKAAFEERKVHCSTTKTRFSTKLFQPEREKLGKHGSKLFRALAIKYVYDQKCAKRRKGGPRGRPPKPAGERSLGYQQRTIWTKKVKHLDNILSNIESDVQEATAFTRDDLQDIIRLATVESYRSMADRVLSLFMLLAPKITRAWQENVLMRFSEGDKQPDIDQAALARVQTWLDKFEVMR